MWRYQRSINVIESRSFEHAYTYALFLLSLRWQTQGEIQQKLHRRGYAPTIIEQILQKLIEHNYIDDKRVAMNLIAHCKQYKLFGYYGIKKKLLEKRLSGDIVEFGLNQSFDLDDEVQIAKKFLTKQKSSKVLTLEDKRKLVSKLRSRGFRQHVISRILF